MALENAPNTIDITDIQFKSHSKYQLFDGAVDLKQFNGVDLLVAASSLGLIIVGRPTGSEIQVIQLSDVVERKDGSQIPIRTIDIPGIPYLLALSCDHEILSVCYTMSGSSFIDLYSVRSFLSTNVRCIFSKIVVSSIANVKVTQILWNPIIANTMALCLSDGTLGAYAFKDQNYEFNSLSPEENIRCACWSPKGKQIVAACPGGKLAQYKPDLKLAKTIPCEAQLFPSPYTPIAIQWLATYQFAVVFVEQKVDGQQALFIINAPKNVKPTYINYYDITYSQSGPRVPQVFLEHILQWNVLLMASSNGTEIGILGTSESGEIPRWTQYNLIDEGRAELPLTADNQDTFPTGLVLETGSTHQIMIGENKIPVMPMLHILSTHGLLLSFNILNFQPTRVDICSPPQSLADKSALSQFKMSPIGMKAPAATPPRAPPTVQPDNLRNILSTPSTGGFQSNANISFAIPDTGATSTPAKQPTEIQPSFAFKPTAKVDIPPVVESIQASPIVKTNMGPKDLFKASPAPAPTIAIKSEPSEPFITIKPAAKPTTQSQKQKQPTSLTNSENDKILQEMLKQEVYSFHDEINAVLQRSRSLRIDICGKDELSTLIRNIDEMQGILLQANESVDSMKSDVQSLHLTLYEMLAMLSESQAKLRDFNSSNASDGNMAATQMHRRLITKLQTIFMQTQTRYEAFSKQLDANWSAHIQKQRENDKARMKIPTMEHVYQTIRKQQQILMREREQIKKIKGKIGTKAAAPEQKIVYSYSNSDNLKMNTLINSVLSLSIRDQMKTERKALDTNKLDALRELTLKKRQMNYVKPTRPVRNDLSSKFIIDKRLAYEQQRMKQKAQSNVVIPKEIAPQTVAVPKEPMQKVQASKVNTATTNFGKVLLETPPRQKAFKNDPIPTTTFTLPTNDAPKKIDFTAALSKPATAPAPVAVDLKTTGSIAHSTAGSAKPFSFQFSGATPSVTPSPSTVTPAVAPAGESLLHKPKTIAFNLAKTAGETTAPSIAAVPKTAFGSQNLSFGSLPAKDNVAKPAVQAPPVVSSSPAIVKALTSSPVTSQPQTPIAAQVVAQKASEPKVSPFTVQTQTPTKVDPPKTNLFGSLSASSTPTSAPFGSTASAAPAINSFSFALGGASSPASTAITTSAQTTPNQTQSTAQAPPTTAANQSPFSFSTANKTTSSPGQVLVSTSAAAATISSPNVSNANNSAADDGSLFKGFNICKPNTPSSTTSIFGGASVSAAPVAAASTPSIFGGSSTPAAPANNMFGAKAATDVTSAQPPQPTTGNIFGGNSADSAPLSFASFNLSSSSNSAAPTINTPTPTPTTGNIFGSVASGQSMFGGSPNTSSASIFGGASNNSNSSAPPTGLFGSVSSPPSNNSANTGNLFGGASAGGASVFGGSSALGASPVLQPAATGASVFGSPSSGFGSFAKAAAATPAFGTGAMFQQQSFGQSSPQAPSNMFGSMNQQPNSGGFGIGSGVANQAFGSAPVFGGAPTLGNTKAGFGTFANASPNASFGPPQQGNSLFESLGSSNNTMTFGNLAQNQNTPPTQKPFSGGSSFSSWR